MTFLIPLQPMLCVSAVNPFLYSKVPALQHVTNIRKKIVQMIPYVRCPFRRSIYKALGTRKYLLESIDFFALRDLIDLSKGMFAGQHPKVIYILLSGEVTVLLMEICLDFFLTVMSLYGLSTVVYLVEFGGLLFFLLLGRTPVNIPHVTNYLEFSC